MQRTLTSLMLLAISVIVIHAVIAKRSGQVPILKVRDIREHGLVIVGRSDPDFESLRGVLSQEGVRLDLSIQPYVFIKNLGNKRMSGSCPKSHVQSPKSLSPNRCWTLDLGLWTDSRVSSPVDTSPRPTPTKPHFSAEKSVVEADSSLVSVLPV